jgi:RimJ/RimL family protein N-acetyltransferase
MPEPTYRPVTGADRDDLARFLSEHHWPFHVRADLGPAEAAEMVAGWDLGIAEGHRGAGIGTAAVRWLGGEVFGGWPGVRRIEAQTRRDNQAMRTVLGRCGYVKEAHYRRGWPAQDGAVHDGIGYALLREDWERGTTTPVDWDG